MFFNEVFYFNEFKGIGFLLGLLLVNIKYLCFLDFFWIFFEVIYFCFFEIVVFCKVGRWFKGSRVLSEYCFDGLLDFYKNYSKK